MSTSLVVRRDKKRHRRIKQQDHTDENDILEGNLSLRKKKKQTLQSRPSFSSSLQSTEEPIFVFRVNKESPHRSKHKIDTKTAANALVTKKQRALKRQLRQKRKEEYQADTNLQLKLSKELTNDQMQLYKIFSDQIKIETKRTKHEFATSSACKDVVHITEQSFLAMKQEFIYFLKTSKPSYSGATLPNPENEKLKKLLMENENKLNKLDKTIERWEKIRNQVIQETENSPKKLGKKRNLDTEIQENEIEEIEEISYELQIVPEIEERQQEVLNRVGNSTQQLVVLEDAMQAVDRLILQADIRKAELFEAYHSRAFQGYANIMQPKENLRALLKLSAASSHL